MATYQAALDPTFQANQDLLAAANILADRLKALVTDTRATSFAPVVALCGRLSLELARRDINTIRLTLARLLVLKYCQPE